MECHTFLRFADGVAVIVENKEGLSHTC